MENWYCVYTKNNLEEHVSMRIGSIPGIEAFYPQISTLSKGRTGGTQKALFPCYIFSKFDPSIHYHMIKYTRGVRRIMGDTCGEPYIVDEEIIQQIRLRLKDGLIKGGPQELKSGDRILINDGPLKGLDGVFQKDLKSRDRVIVMLNMISYQATAEVERQCLSIN